MESEKKNGFGLFREVLLLLLTVAYVALPTDLWPDFLPTGWVDDGAVAVAEAVRLIRLQRGGKTAGFFSVLSRTIIVIAILAAIGVVALLVGVVALIVYLCQ